MLLNFQLVPGFRISIVIFTDMSLFIRHPRVLVFSTMYDISPSSMRKFTPRIRDHAARYLYTNFTKHCLYLYTPLVVYSCIKIQHVGTINIYLIEGQSLPRIFSHTLSLSANTCIPTRRYANMYAILRHSPST